MENGSDDGRIGQRRRRVARGRVRPEGVDHRVLGGVSAVAIVPTVLAGYLLPGVRLLAVLAAGVIAQGALFRRARRIAAPGLRGLRWGRDEWRLLGGQLLVLGLLFC
ncbi:hypothetical protein ACRAWD_08165 [Caulobacter segnis]